MKTFLLIPVFIFLLQGQDEMLIGRWRMILDRGKFPEEHIEIVFKKDHTFELYKHGKPKPGRWKTDPGKKTLGLAEIQQKDFDEMRNLRVTKDSLFFSEGSEDMVFLRIR